MVDSEYSMDIYKSLKVSIEILVKNPLILKFVPDHLKLNKCVSTQLKKYFF